MSVLQMTPCVLTENWSELVEWCAMTFDIPVACRFDKAGWGRLATTSPGVTIISNDHFQASTDGREAIVELEVSNLKAHFGRAVRNGAEVVTEPSEVSPGSLHAAIRTPQGVLMWLYQSGPRTGSDEINDGPVNFDVSRLIDAPIDTVFAAATQAAHLTKSFVDAASGDLGPGQTVTWTWDHYGSGDVHVTQFRPNKFLAFRWRGAADYDTRVQYAFTEEEGKTRLAITESGFDNDARGLKEAFDNCGGWTQFLASLKTYLEHGIEKA